MIGTSNQRVAYPAQAQAVPVQAYPAQAQAMPVQAMPVQGQTYPVHQQGMPVAAQGGYPAQAQAMPVAQGGYPAQAMPVAQAGYAQQGGMVMQQQPNATCRGCGRPFVQRPEDQGTAQVNARAMHVQQHLFLLADPLLVCSLSVVVQYFRCRECAGISAGEAGAIACISCTIA